MKSIRDWILLISVAVLSAFLYLIFSDQVNNLVLILIILIVGFATGKISNSYSRKKN